MEPNLKAVAASIKWAQDNACRIAPITDQYPEFDIESAYQVAELIHKARLAEMWRESRVHTIGRKIGLTNSALWPVYHVHAPIWGYMYDRTVTFADADSVRCPIGRFVEPKIEPEIILHFHRQPPITDNPAEILQAVDWIAHGFEIVQSHYPNWRFKAADTIADAGLHGMLIVGRQCHVNDIAGDLVQALARFEVTLLCNQEHRDAGKGANVLGSPLAAASYLTKLLAGQLLSQPLEAGEIVTTGSLTQPHSVRAGEIWSTQVTGIDLPGLSVQFEE